MAQNLSAFLMFFGALLMFIAALGVARMPDLFTRMHSSTKSATLGVGLIMLGSLHLLWCGTFPRALEQSHQCPDRG